MFLNQASVVPSIARKKIRKTKKEPKERPLKLRLVEIARQEPTGFKTYVQRKLNTLYNVQLGANWGSIAKFIINKNIPENDFNEFIGICKFEMMNLQFAHQLNNQIGFAFSEDEDFQDE